MRIEKEEIRKDVIRSLQAFSEKEKKEIEQQLYATLFASKLWAKAKTVGLTLSKGFEWNTTPIIEQAWEEGKKVVVPKSVHASRALHFYQIEQFDQVEEGYFGLDEPIPERTERLDKDEIELMIVPGVVFTERGYRIGFGGGYYDRFLADYPNATLSLIHSNQLVDRIPVEAHDIPVKFLITERSMLSTDPVEN